MHTATATAGPTGTRRRGEALVEAIHEAVLAELALRGFDALSIEGVAERAHTGKASIYRRWPSKLELVLDAIDSALPSFPAPPDREDLREELLCVLRRIARHMNSRAGTALRACMSDVKEHNELSAAVRDRLMTPRKAVLLEVLRRAASRGEVRPEALTDRIVELGPMLLHAERQQAGALRDRDVIAIVDEVLIPVLRPVSSQS